MIKKIVLCLTALIFSFSIYANPATTDWMSQIPNDRIFNQLIIPGTHDSGTDSISSSSLFSLSDPGVLPVWLEEISNILPISILRPIVAKWSKTQSYTITQQLNNGIRYFDFRVCYVANRYASDFYLCHTMLGDHLANVLNEIQTFVKAHPSEIIIIDFNHLYGINSSELETSLITMLESYLGDFAIPNTYKPNNSIGQIRQSGRQLIILMDLNQPLVTLNLQQFAATYLWHEQAIYSPWPHASTVTALKNILDSEVTLRKQIIKNANNLFVLQAIQTEDTNQVIDGILNPMLYPNDVEHYETPVNQALGDWINNYIATLGKSAINIVLQDWFTNQSSLVSSAIQYDSEEDSPQQDTITNENKLKRLKQWYLTQQTKSP